jgi:hypothetical protein
MTTSLYFSDKGVNEYDAKNRRINKDFFGFDDIKLETALIKKYSSSVALTAIDPTVSKNSFENLCIKNIPFLIPTKETLRKFVKGCELLAYIDYDSIMMDDDIDENILSLIVEIIQRNIKYLIDNKAYNLGLYCFKVAI